ncbi:MAG TPA: hypothetical protein IAC04_01030 [Candidatus Coprenecus stercoravium]|uniref:Uncharacterized protein n=1 Tax=Candidatus Coprenecus stercoravium TaxID=2840735 RepID=A0A9D2GN05_9BACT|nr:hypothetical protein [Candidatus Coprenecus stercoravium]
MNPLIRLRNWYSAQTPAAKGMIWIGLLLIIGIILRWDYISERVVSSFGILNFNNQ